ncbi:hypothetical protein CLV80_11290 [Yoonia maritima]|uniref:Alpha 1,4-glycosyltransferase n=1 Tax=Yoonia maritima TaxID=1435347 RepID=A0A2T0VVP3_9RHOB|nr:hypothetical protein [Yoonia maritima]PRY75503.1 hypothetical protein CLV80_11290 [Yoonia maritima]
MADLPPVGALWIGGSLTWLEQLCLKSFVDQGHQTILYTYGKVTGVPEGVEIRDGNTVLPTDRFITHDRSGSVALFSDLFRFHMIANDPDIIYVDTDVYSVKPFPGNESHVFGYETRTNEKNEGQINGAILRMPQDSPALQGLLEFTKDEYPIPEWLPRKRLVGIKKRAEEGNPMHVSELPWGVWGPLGVTAFLRKTGEAKHARSTDVYYPVHFADRRIFIKRPMLTRKLLTEDTRCIHIWAPIKRFCAFMYDGIPPENSYLDVLLKKHDIDPRESPTIAQHDRGVLE